MSRISDCFLILKNLRALLNLARNSSLSYWNWFESFRTRQSLGPGGVPIPWITYPAISFLEERVTKEMTVYEYGCGNSTLWWAARVSSVDAVEHDRSWFDQILPLLPQNVHLTHVPLEYGGDYSQSISRSGKFYDVVVVDGRDRSQSAKSALPFLNPTGCLIWDNTDRSEYRDGIAFLKAAGFRQLRFRGFSPITTIENETSIFYRASNCLRI
jgi:hypothetical protein